MAKTSTLLLSLALTFLALSPASLAQWGPLQSGLSGRHHRLQRGQQIFNDCNINRLSANEPSIRHQWEAGVTEIWDPNQEEFQCVGVTVARDVIEPRGLLLPHYVNTPLAFYVVQGKGLLGANFPGCPETYESGSESFSQEGFQGSESFSEEGFRGSERSNVDRHQKVRHLRTGDVVVLPPGVSHWVYNVGEKQLVIVALYDLNNVQNQLDLNLRKFFLAGNPQQSQFEHQGRHNRREGAREGISMGNIFSGFDQELLAIAFGVERDTIQKIQGQNENRGAIVRVEKELRIVAPEFEEEEHRGRHEERHSINGLEEGSFCAASIQSNIDRPEKADIYNRHGGHLIFLNRNKLPILNYLDLSIDKVDLYQNAIMTPHWSINSHRVLYFTRGGARVQVASEKGDLVFDETVREGQLLVIPQNFVVLKQAEQEGLEWVVFNTHGESKLSTLAGPFSAIRSMPDAVIMNSYGVSKEEAHKLKYNRLQSHFFQPSSASRRQ